MEKIEIPIQLKNERFILLNPKDKIPLAGEKWRTKKDRYTYSYGDKKLVEHISKGGNYGVICGGMNSLVVVDFDDVSDTDVQQVVKDLGETFTVKTRRGVHLYYYVPGFTGGTTIKLGNGHVDVRSDGLYVVGPNCVHPSGLIYRVVNDIDIRVLGFSTFVDWLAKHGKKIGEGVDAKGTDDFVFDIDQAPYWVQVRLRSILHSDNELREMIQHGIVPKRFPSRSERDYYAIIKLIGYGLKRYIPAIFMAYPIGEKMREHTNPRHYIKHSIKRAMVKYGLKEYPEAEKALMKLHMAKDKHTLAMMSESILKEISVVDDEMLHDFVISALSKRSGVSKRSLWKKLKAFQESIHEPSLETLSDLVNEEVMEIEYWLKPYIPKGSLIIFGGRPGSFKSNIILLFSLLLASKTPYAGNVFKQMGTPRILIYDLENDKQIRASRIQYLIRGIGIEPSDVITFKTSFTKYDIKKELEFCKDYDIIVLDSYRRFLRGSENDSEITDRFYRSFLKPLKDMKKTIIIIHHFKKTPRDMNFTEDALLEAFRGSTDIVSQVDIAYGVIKSMVNYGSDGLEFSVYLMPNKNRYGLSIPPIKFDINKDDIRKKTTIMVSYTAVASGTDFVKDAIIRTLMELERIEKSVLINSIVQQTRYSAKTVRNVLNEMKALGMILEEGKVVKLDTNLVKILEKDPEEVKCL